MRLRLFVEGRGSVVAATVESGSAAEALRACASRVAAELRFPSRASHTTVFLRVHFGTAAPSLRGRRFSALRRPTARTMRRSWNPVPSHMFVRLARVSGTSVFVAGSLQSATGPLAAGDVHSVVEAGADALAQCVYQRQGSDSGTVTLSFAVQADGSVATAMVDATTLSDTSVGACLLGELQAMRFSTSSGATQVRYIVLVNR